ncbi:Protein of unknown function (DUF3160), partial [Candidatus Methanophagaceae archaeon]
MNTKHSTLIVLTFIAILLTSGCVQQPPAPEEEPPTLELKPIAISSVQSENQSFVKYYSLDPINTTLQVPQYELPLQTTAICNYDKFSTELELCEAAQRLLEKNGFVVISNPFNPHEADITEPYDTLKEREIPVFITSDSLLHLYHIQFDETLRQIEEREFYELIWGLSTELLNDSIADYNSYNGDLKEAARRNVAYFAVGLSLLQPKADQVCQ